MTLSEYEVRNQRLQSLKNAGVILYADKFERTHNIGEVIIKKNELGVKDSESIFEGTKGKKIKIAGRIMTFRTHGKLSFATIKDGYSSIQICFMKDNIKFFTGKEFVENIYIDGENISSYKFVEKYFDIGDFIGLEGELFYTKKGELTVFVDFYQMLSKSISPWPEKFKGITDIDTIYRQRYLDLTMNEDSYNRFLFRSEFLKKLRDFYHENGFIEVETPILGNAASGASAQPFITYHNDFDEELYLRISPETSLKKATVGRFEKVFEIAKNFRNEGSDPSHMQEFTMVEHYAAYWNFEDNILFSEKMMDYLFDNLGISRKINVQGKEGDVKEVDFSTPWERIDYIEGVKNASGIDVSKYEVGDEDKLKEDIKKQGINIEGIENMGLATMIDYLYKKVLRPSIVGPAVVYNYPKTMQPLARTSDKNPNIVEQYQLVVNGWEIMKGYSELVDPIVQKQNFEEQAKAAEKGDEEATSGDDDFVKAMEYGMPPQSGFGMGIDRILTILTENDNLRDVVLFPLVKSGKNISNGEENDEKNIKLPSIEAANNLVEEYAGETKQHLYSVGYVMRYFAEKLGRNQDYRYLAGLLHDVDWDYIGKDDTIHCGEQFEKLLSQINAPKEIIEDIKSHVGDVKEEDVNNTVRKYLCSVDELTGFIIAILKVLPNQDPEELKVKSIKKKIKDKSFAKGVDRQHLKRAEDLLGYNMDEFIEEIINALKYYRSNIGI